MLERVVVETYKKARKELGDFLGYEIEQVPVNIEKLGNFSANYENDNPLITIDESLAKWTIPREVMNFFKKVYALAGQEPTQENVLKGYFIHELAHHIFREEYVNRITIKKKDLARFPQYKTDEQTIEKLSMAVSEAFAYWLADEVTNVRTLYSGVLKSYKKKKLPTGIISFFYFTFGEMSDNHGHEYILENLSSIVEGGISRAFNIEIASLRQTYHDFIHEQEIKTKKLDPITDIVRRVSTLIKSIYQSN